MNRAATFLRRSLAGFLAAAVLGGPVSAQTPPAPPPPLKVLLVSGGCSHDYETRVKILVQGIRERIQRPMEWVVRLDGVGESGAKLPWFESAEWAKGYDLVIHDHCFPRVRDEAYIDRILAPHRSGTPAVLVHGTMFSFPTPDGRWSAFTGAVIRSHERERPLRVEPLANSAPIIIEGTQAWEIPLEELYRVESIGEGVVPLAEGTDPAGKRHPVMWTHRYGPARTRVFASTIGNATATLADPVSLDLLARGVLWSLDLPAETLFRTVPSADSLKGLTIPPVAEPLLRPGRNVTWQGTASGFQWGQATAGESAALVIDGDPVTAWRPPGTGPGWWEVRLASPASLSLAAVWWEGKALVGALLEGSSDGRTWTTLATLPPPVKPNDPVLVRFDPRSIAGLRLSVPKTAPGEGFALREVAAYASEDDLPSAILAANPDPPGLVRFHTAGSGDRSGIRLAPGWTVASLENTGLQGRPEQLLSTASGRLFVSLFPADGGEGRVHQIDRSGGGDLVSGVFLSDLAPDTRIAWDGEWLYTLSGPGPKSLQFERVRKALGPGPADERQRLGGLFRLPEEGGPAGFRWTGLGLDPDGWLRARYRTESPGSVVRADGRSLPLAREGAVRFRRDGSGLASCDDPHPGPGIEEVAEIQSLLAWNRDGERIWFLTSGEDGLWLGRLEPESAKESPGIDLDTVPTTSLPGRIEAKGGDAAARELAFELARRKGDPLPEVTRLLAAAPPRGLAESLVAAIAALPEATARPHLISLATGSSGPPEVRAAAFRALGDFGGELDPGVFRALGEVTDPTVSAAIFEGMRRRGITLPGAEVIALRLAHHPDSGLAEAGFAFLRDRGAVDAAFAALGTPARREDWPRAFDLLAALPDPAVVEGIAGRLETTRDPDERRGLLDTLCRIRTLPDGKAWSQTPVIEARLRRALADHRVDRAALLAAMVREGISSGGSGQLVTLARELPPLEPFVVETLSESRAHLSKLESGWLERLAKDPDRDEALRDLARRRLGQAPSLPRDSVAPQLPPAAPGPMSGIERFRREGCAVCHNLDGEGPSAGPDLVARFLAIPEAERAEWLSNPGTDDWVRLETSDGRRWTGWIASRDAKMIEWVDLAGNRFSPVGVGELGKPHPRAAVPVPCQRLSEWSEEARTSFRVWLDRVVD